MKNYDSKKNKTPSNVQSTYDEAYINIKWIAVPIWHVWSLGSKLAKMKVQGM